jgi:hypothetical protein
MLPFAIRNWQSKKVVPDFISFGFYPNFIWISSKLQPGIPINSPRLIEFLPFQPSARGQIDFPATVSYHYTLKILKGK